MHELESSHEGPNLAGSSAAGPTWEGRVEPHNTQTEWIQVMEWSGVCGVESFQTGPNVSPLVSGDPTTLY